MSWAKLVHSAEAAEILNVSPAWLARHRWAGTGPLYVRVGGPRGRAVRYRLEDLQNWIQQNIAPAQGGSHGAA